MNAEIEKSLIGSMLESREAIADVAAILQPGDFFLPSLGSAYQTILNRWNNNEPLDPVTVADDMNGGGTSVADLMDCAELALPAHAKYHAEIIKRESRKRQLMHIVAQAHSELEAGADARDVAAKLSTNFQPLFSDELRGAVGLDDVLIAATKGIDEAGSEGIEAVYIPTGLTGIDSRLGGIRRGHLVVIGARPGMGKTALATTIAINAAKAGYPGLLISCEMGATEIGQRILSMQSGIENRLIQRGKVSDFEAQRIVEAQGELAELPLRIYDQSRDWGKIKTEIRRAKASTPELSLVAVDYVGLIGGLGKNKPRYQEIGEITADCKELARELQVGFVLLSQLNREIEGRGDGSPRLSDLRESGNLEQDADIVLLLNQEVESINNDGTVVFDDGFQLHVAKNRHGIAGNILVKFNRKIVQFTG